MGTFLPMPLVVVLELKLVKVMLLNYLPETLLCALFLADLLNSLNFLFLWYRNFLKGLLRSMQTTLPWKRLCRPWRPSAPTSTRPRGRWRNWRLWSSCSPTSKAGRWEQERAEPPHLEWKVWTGRESEIFEILDSEAGHKCNTRVYSMETERRNTFLIKPQQRQLELKDINYHITPPPLQPRYFDAVFLPKGLKGLLHFHASLIHHNRALVLGGIIGDSSQGAGGGMPTGSPANQKSPEKQTPMFEEFICATFSSNGPHLNIHLSHFII